MPPPRPLAPSERRVFDEQTTLEVNACLALGRHRIEVDSLRTPTYWSGLPIEVWKKILLAANSKEVYTLGKSSSDLSEVASTTLLGRFRNVLHRFAPFHVPELEHVLRKHDGVIAGQGVAGFHSPAKFDLSLLGGDDAVLIIICPLDQVFFIGRYFQQGVPNHWRYLPAPASKTPKHIIPYAAKSQKFTMCLTSTFGTVYIVGSATAGPLGVIGAAEASPWYSYMTPDGAWFAYEEHWDTGLSILNYTHADGDALNTLKKKDSETGWDVAAEVHDCTSDTWNTFKTHECGVDPQCPLTMLSSAKDGLLIAFNTDHDVFKFPSNRQLCGETARWRMGGYHCTRGRALPYEEGILTISPDHDRV